MEKFVKQATKISEKLVEEFDKTPQYISDNGFYGNTQTVRVEINEEISETLSNFRYQNFFRNVLKKHCDIIDAEIISCSISANIIGLRIRTEWI